MSAQPAPSQTPYAPDAVDALCARLGAWKPSPERTSLHRRFVFADFSAAFAFMTQAALWAERRDHHPDWSNVYRTVDVTLLTHDCAGVTDLDAAFAEAMNGWADALGAQSAP